MKPVKASSIARAAIAIALAASALSCSTSHSSRSPTLSLTADSYSPYSDQDVLFSASASDPDGYPISYAWSIDGIAQGGEYGAAISRYWLTPNLISSEISATVTNSQGRSTTKSVTVTIYPAASLRVINNASYPITQVYVTTHSSPWGNNQLGSATIPSGYYYTVVGIAGGYAYDFEAYISATAATYDTTSTYGTSLVMYNGYYRDFTIADALLFAVSDASTAYSVKSLAPAAPSAAAIDPRKTPSGPESGSILQFHKTSATPSVEPQGQPLKRQ
jgi:hypothetical protein